MSWVSSVFSSLLFARSLVEINVITHCLRKRLFDEFAKTFPQNAKISSLFCFRKKTICFLHTCYANKSANLLLFWMIGKRNAISFSRIATLVLQTKFPVRPTIVRFWQNSITRKQKVSLLVRCRCPSSLLWSAVSYESSKIGEQRSFSLCVCVLSRKQIHWKRMSV